MSSFYTYAKHYGNSILFRGIENGKRVSGKRDFKPTMFVKSDKPSKYKSMYGESVSPIQFDSNKEAAEFAERYKEVSNFPIYGQTNWNYQFLTEKYPNDIEWDINQIKIFSVDIETTVENGFPDVFNPLEKILLITLQDNTTKKITTFGTGPFTQTSETSQYDVDYKQCRDERELLVRFLDWWAVNTPDVLTGWNTDFFDVPYLISRVDRILDDDYVKMFSPFKLVRRNIKKIMGREQLT
jgi:DNA polymerase elongation subunit (family B)